MNKNDVSIAGVSLRSFKSFANRHEGALAFSADVFINGQKAGWVSDDGNGGCMLFSPRELEDRLNVIAATLPDQVATPEEMAMGLREDDGSPVVTKMTGDLLIAQIGDRIDLLKTLKSRLRNRVLLIRADKTALQTKPLTTQKLEKTLMDGGAAIRKQWPDTTKILNLMPLPEALDAFAAHF